MKKDLQVKDNIIEFIPAIRMLLSDTKLKITRLRYNTVNSPYCNDRKKINDAAASFNPTSISGWDGKYIFLEDTNSPENIINLFIKVLAEFKSKNPDPPKIVVIENYGILAIGDNSRIVNNLLDEFDEHIEKINSFPGEIDSGVQSQAAKNESLNNAFSRSGPGQGLLNQKICIVTGGAQGFGEGISRSLLNENANLVIADLNEEKGRTTTSSLKSLCNDNELVFIKTDVSDSDSIKNLILQTVKYFGGIDLFVSNAGILKAGGLDEMDAASFELMTKINYEGYFLCAKYSSSVMKLQSKYKAGYFSDIIQINSKSGLKGSNRNFAYAGGKFGGIGLTQSFALELAPFRIKVNAICPGNFFEGPLWADPDNGLFVQYLKTGKVPGAKTIEDVKRFYEKRIPLGRGCTVQDVMKALVYIISQEYETGQAVPVTGGQEMLS